MFKLVVASIFKNESHILEEWLDHYITRGVEHFYLVNDFSTDDYLSVLKKEKYDHLVTLYDNDIVHNMVGRQVEICNKYFKSKMKLCTWMAIIDLDEFLYSPTQMNLPNVLKKYSKYSQITVDWLNFGSNGHIIQPDNVVKSFTKRAVFDKKQTYYSFKSIILSKKFKNFNVHMHGVDGNGIHLHFDENKLPDLIINHYSIQSQEFFVNVKGKRGDVNNWFNNNGLLRNLEYFQRYDTNDIEDLHLVNQNEKNKLT